MNTIVFDGNELEAKLAEYARKGLKDNEIFNALLSEGYTLDSFRYNKSIYNRFQRVASTGEPYHDR